MLLIVLCQLSFLAVAGELSGLVVGVSDGDTIKVLDDSRHVHTVRLMGIDAPEKAQAYGQRSKQSLSDLIYRQNVLVEWSKRDKYGRTVGKVLSQDGAGVCLEQITSGMAWHYTKYASEQSREDRERYAEAEKVAREAKIGLWQEDVPMPPWVWRHSKPN
ncbi:MAG: Thermonuclease precursor [Pseudomonadota bacterium]|jgi:endonuclease YncB( thermonuclease family)